MDQPFFILKSILIRFSVIINKKANKKNTLNVIFVKKRQQWGNAESKTIYGIIFARGSNPYE